MAKGTTGKREGATGGRITDRSATDAAKAAKRAFDQRPGKSAEWQKGGREWERVLGSFGPVEKSSKK